VNIKQIILEEMGDFDWTEHAKTPIEAWKLKPNTTYNILTMSPEGEREYNDDMSDNLKSLPLYDTTFITDDDPFDRDGEVDTWIGGTKIWVQPKENANGYGVWVPTKGMTVIPH
jgi:hypothetical protein